MEKKSAKPSTEDIEKEAKEDEEKVVPNFIDSRRLGRKLYESYKRDLGVSEFTMKRAIKSVGEWVVNVETQRNLQMRNDFDEEKEYKLEKQKEIQNQIEELSNDNESEKMIKYFNEKILQQETLFQQYSEIKNKIDLKMQLIKNILPDLQKRESKYKKELRQLNRENLKLMEQINKFENQISDYMEEDLNAINYDSNDINNLYNNSNNNNNISTNLMISNNSIRTNKTLSTNANNNSSNSQNINALNSTNNNNRYSISDNNNNSNFNNSVNLSRSINIPDILERDENLKKKMAKIIKLRETLREKKSENNYLMRSINVMNNNYFKCKRVYTEGMHEVAKELLRINEMELDKVINNSNTTFNSLYFDIYKTNFNNGKANNDLLRLPIINNNIKKKFKYPITEKSEPNDLLFKVIKNIIEENNNNNKINNMKKNKFSWDEFKDFSAYQIYTLLNINKDILNSLDNCIFPTQVLLNDEL